ncbi:HigA family addiction module antitoxin [Dolichospermum planctonicum CS-1226]|uniref:HigA family addiction module antitoxin n=1 Tax=Dolichospermum planctonicum CS-1226 TaxID=3021751 RepID=A0ABT5AFC4_9CYAN|nr:HigA family addiction module antitoxin [Dolichospermum planctonicum]MDB9535667.1 HigA family addiction module antitoxin [Dolichospermum planctonicum CS-1226]
MESKIQNRYNPDYVSHPGDTLLEVLEDRGMTQAELAERTGRPKKTINEIIKGKAAITPETALQLERVFNIPASFWNNRERHYREFLAQKEEKKRLAKQVPWLK